MIVRSVGVLGAFEPQDKPPPRVFRLELADDLLQVSRFMLWSWFGWFPWSRERNHYCAFLWDFVLRAEWFVFKSFKGSISLGSADSPFISSFAFLEAITSMHFYRTLSCACGVLSLECGGGCDGRVGMISAIGEVV